ncbi:MAG: hypothetical protein ACKO50_09355 [Cyanobium sp.]
MNSTKERVSAFLASLTPLGGLFSGAAALIAGTWVVANVAVQSKMSSLENELSFYKSTKSVDIPTLMHELQKFVGPANAKLELSQLKVEHEVLKAEHSKIKISYEALKRSTKLTDRFSLKAGQARPILNGKVVVGVKDISPGYIYATFNNDNAGFWNVGEYKTAELAGIEYRIMLEEISGVAVFRVDEMPISKAQN